MCKNKVQTRSKNVKVVCPLCIYFCSIFYESQVDYFHFKVYVTELRV